jgi:hypothetical protein
MNILKRHEGKYLLNEFAFIGQHDWGSLSHNIRIR